MKRRTAFILSSYQSDVEIPAKDVSKIVLEVLRLSFHLSKLHLVVDVWGAHLREEG